MLLCLTALYAQRADNYPPTKNAQVKLSETNLPIVFIDVNGKMILREERITAKIKIIDNGTGKTNYADLAAHPDQKVDYEGYISLKYRGNSSFNSSDKKPLRLQDHRQTAGRRRQESEGEPAGTGQRQRLGAVGAFL